MKMFGGKKETKIVTKLQPQKQTKVKQKMILFSEHRTRRCKGSERLQKRWGQLWWALRGHTREFSSSPE